MPTASYQQRRGQLETYFDQTAVDAWSRLTSDAPVSGIRATVRAGRDRMRAILLDWLPRDLTGRRILDAGCGTGAFSVEAARRGADVVAVDLSPTLVDLARERSPKDLGQGSIDFRVGDMLSAGSESFDHVVAMDSLIHYRMEDVLRTVSAFAANTRHSIVFTFAPRTPALTVMHAVGRLFPHSDRAPAIEPVSPGTLKKAIGRDDRLAGWQFMNTERVNSGFYTSQGAELRKE